MSSTVHIDAAGRYVYAMRARREGQDDDSDRALCGLVVTRELGRLQARIVAESGICKACRRIMAEPS